MRSPSKHEHQTTVRANSNRLTEEFLIVQWLQ